MSLLLKYWVRYASILDQVLRYAFVILFVYAGMSKLLDFETFQVQLAQSPLLSAYAGFVAWAVPLSEFLIAILLLVDRTRVWGLSGFFFLMVMFTTYIIIILNFADFIPCSCGGVLEKMSWGQHLVFNVVFVLVSGLLLFFQFSGNWRRRVLLLGSQVVLGVGVVSVLFAFSEKKMHRNNAFVRRYVPHAATQVAELDLRFNSFYIAGMNSKKIFIGNATTPLRILSIDTSFQTVDSIVMKLNQYELPFKLVTTAISGTSLYVSDETVPIIFKGDIQNWESKSYCDTLFFTAVTPIDSQRTAIRRADAGTLKNFVEILDNSYNKERSRIYFELPAKDNGVFESDGQLLWNQKLQTLIYVYFYSNKYFLYSLDRKNLEEFKTIDTVSSPHLEIITSNKRRQNQLKKNFIKINEYSATSGDYIFIKTTRLGRSEPKSILKEASIIDVYDIVTREYLGSLYIYNHKNKKLSTFIVKDKFLYGIMEDMLVKFDISSVIP